MAKLRCLYISTRLNGTDGVSLESFKLAKIIEELGFEPHYCAGELDSSRTNNYLIPEMHFNDKYSKRLGKRAFEQNEAAKSLLGDIYQQAEYLKEKISKVVTETKPNLIVVQNIWAIPMQLPLAKAVADIVKESKIACLSHEHDYYWERKRFAGSNISGYLEKYFPFHANNVWHASINSLAQNDLQERKSLNSCLLPNVFDFHTPAPSIDSYNADFREAIGIAADERLILQPTRVVERKGIELAIELLAELADSRNILLISHHAGDEGLAYLKRLKAYAKDRKVELRYIADRIDAERKILANRKIYSLWDSYIHADFVSYPSLYEGFGNALLETVYFKKPALVNCYSVYVADIAPKGFQFVEINGKITNQAVGQVVELLDNKAKQKLMTDHNYAIAKKHYSFESLKRILVRELKTMGFKL